LGKEQLITPSQERRGRECGQRRDARRGLGIVVRVVIIIVTGGLPGRRRRRRGSPGHIHRLPGERWRLARERRRGCPGWRRRGNRGWRRRCGRRPRRGHLVKARLTLMGFERIAIRNRGGDIRVIVALILGDFLVLAIMLLHDRNRRRLRVAGRDAAQWQGRRGRRRRRRSRLGGRRGRRRRRDGRRPAVALVRRGLTRGATRVVNVRRATVLGRTRR
jgi:hypothetical protein